MDARATFTSILQELRALIVQFRPHVFKASNLTAACGFSSFVIEKALRELGYRAEVVIGTWAINYTHAWVEAEGFILDVTLTQFEEGQPRIKVAKTKACKLYKADVRGEVAHREFQGHEDDDFDPRGWGDQSPYKHLDRVEEILSKFRRWSLYAAHLAPQT